jgi:hypothetical protein
MVGRLRCLVLEPDAYPVGVDLFQRKASSGRRMPGSVLSLSPGRRPWVRARHLPCSRSMVAEVALAPPGARASMYFCQASIAGAAMRSASIRLASASARLASAAAMRSRFSWRGSMPGQSSFAAGGLRRVRRRVSMPSVLPIVSGRSRQTPDGFAERSLGTTG